MLSDPLADYDEQRMDIIKKNLPAVQFWSQKYLGVVIGELTCDALALGSCQIISLCEAGEKPGLLASSRHVSMDAVSVKSHVWENNQLIVANSAEKIGVLKLVLNKGKVKKC